MLPLSFFDHRPVEVRQGTGYDRITLPPSARYTDAKVQHGIYKDLKRQEKILRDHNLVMGPMSSFSEYFDANSYNPHRSAMVNKSERYDGSQYPRLGAAFLKYSPNDPVTEMMGIDHRGYE
ncbi:hypothetical protein LSH36_26g10038 [Paralvinella palmiformis]|uniref:Uncharacterized protein n=1 Tax=Paralvinella palmiformis TaxID=53620 RepID=A0AAD9KBV1_9ANNE|nr:hypothetical protein LSH36_26g10038 [Paralvinella palmiformis]